MPQNLLAELRKQLKTLKKRAEIDDVKIAAAMREIAPDVTTYQQKVSDFFSGEMKRPEMDFMAALCAALGQSLPTLLSSIERDTPLDLDKDWEWIMFGRRLGPHGRAAARNFVDGWTGNSVAPAGAKPRRAKRRRRVGERSSTD